MILLAVFLYREKPPVAPSYAADKKGKTMPVAKAMKSLITNFNYLAIWFYVAMSLAVYGLFSAALE